MLTGTLAAYDELVPHPPRDERLAGRLAALRDRRPAVDLAQVGDVVIVVSSSRGGCTLLGELLRRCRSLLALPAESNPYVVVAQLGAADPSAVVAAELARVVGRPAEPPADLEAYALEWAWRLCAQWPALEVPQADVERAVAAAATGREVLASLCGRHAAIDERRYDGHSVQGLAGPTVEPVVEMPPFVVPRPWSLADEPALRHLPLVLATPRNAYRVRFLASLFPRARVRILHLVRNPAAAINGLIDGWQHHGFFNCRVPRELAIAGYSDVHPWGRSWWKYDVPPDWETVADAILPEVCALQWRSAHEASLAAIKDHGLEHHTVRYEDLVGPVSDRVAAARALATWLGVPEDELVPIVAGGIDPVMATAPPRAGRWRVRERELRAAVTDERTLALAERLGYSGDWRLWP